MPKPKPNPTGKKWTDPIYGIEHRVLVCSLSEAKAYAKGHFSIDLQVQSHVAALTFSVIDDESGACIINYWFKAGLPLYNREGHALIVHEVAHGIDFAFTHREVPLTVEMSEPRAYYMGAVYLKVCQMLDKHLRPPRPRRKRR